MFDGNQTLFATIQNYSSGSLSALNMATSPIWNGVECECCVRSLYVKGSLQDREARSEIKTERKIESLQRDNDIQFDHARNPC